MAGGKLEAQQKGMDGRSCGLKGVCGHVLRAKQAPSVVLALDRAVTWKCLCCAGVRGCAGDSEGKSSALWLDWARVLSLQLSALL